MASHLFSGLKKSQKDYKFLILSFLTQKKKGLHWVTNFPTGFRRAPRFERGNSRAAAGVKEAMGVRREATHGHLGREVLWRAQPPSWNQSLIPVGDTKWRGKLRETNERGDERSPWGNRPTSLHPPSQPQPMSLGRVLCSQKHTSQKLPPPAAWSQGHRKQNLLSQSQACRLGWGV